MVRLAVALGICVVVMLVAAMVTRRYAIRSGLGAAEATLAGVVVAAVVALGVSELVHPSIGRWWIDHPMMAGVIGGLLSVALTVLAVDAVLERRRAARVRTVMSATLRRLLWAAVPADLVNADLRPDPGDFLIDAKGPDSGHQAALDALRMLSRAAWQISDIIQQVRTELLWAGSDFFVVYEAACEVELAARRTAEQAASFEQRVTPDDMLLLRVRETTLTGPRIRYVRSLWADVLLRHDRLADAIDELGRAITSVPELGGEVIFTPRRVGVAS